MVFFLLTTKVLLGIFIMALPGFSGFLKNEKKILIRPDCEKYKERQAFPCALVLDPICATDNKTYDNYCQFCMFYWALDSKVKFVHYGFCKSYRYPPIVV